MEKIKLSKKSEPYSDVYIPNDSINIPLLAPIHDQHCHICTCICGLLSCLFGM